MWIRISSAFTWTLQGHCFLKKKCCIPFPKASSLFASDRVKDILEFLCQDSISAFLPLMYWDQLTALQEPQLHVARRTEKEWRDGGREGWRAVLDRDTSLLSRGPFESIPCTTSGYIKAAHPSSMTLPKNLCQRCTATPIACQSGRTVHKWKLCFTLICSLHFIPYHKLGPLQWFQRAFQHISPITLK